MDRKRVAGRFVREDVGGDPGGDLRRVVARAPRPKFCRSYARKQVANALPEITEKFVEEAKKGSIQHAKVLMKLGGLDGKEVPKPPRRRGKGVVRKLLDQLVRKDPEVGNKPTVRSCGD